MIDLRLVGKQVYVLGRPKPLASTPEGRRRGHPVGLSSKQCMYHFQNQKSNETKYQQQDPQQRRTTHKEVVRETQVPHNGKDGNRRVLRYETESQERRSINK